MTDLRLPLLLSCALLAAGCQGNAETAATSEKCDPAAAAGLAGQPRVSDEEAKALTGATLVRQIGPGDPVTMDFNDKRVTIETDPSTGRIVQAMCG